MMKVRTVLVLGAVLSGALTSAAAQSAPEQLDLGVFTFVSGPAAANGVPGRQAAELMVDLINEEGGIAGVPVAITIVDEAQGAEGVIAEYRKLAQDDTTDAMIAALSSGNCLALAPLADQFEMPTIAWNCDTHQLFASGDVEYVVRPNGNTIPEFTAFAAYLHSQLPDVRRVAIINPDYAFGHDAAAIVKGALGAIDADIEIVAELFPRLGAGTYQTEISRLAALRPDAIFSNLWGADLENFVRQAAPRGLFDQSKVVLALGETILGQGEIPDGTIAGVLGDGYWRSDEAGANERTQAFVAAYRERFGENPVFPAMKMANAFVVLETAYTRAIEANGGTWPSGSELIAALRGTDVDTLTGTARIRDDNDAVVDQIIGTVATQDGEKILTDIVRIEGTALMPPIGEDPLAWLASRDASFFDEVPVAGGAQ